MWILTSEQLGGETHYLLCNKEYVVGRKNCDILLPSDQSISRAHAHLSASDQDLIIKDTSKYGTSVNNQKITSPVKLKSGDKVTFGVFQNKFSVIHCVKPVVCSSSLDSDGKTALSQALLTLGGKLVNNWTPECTHLVMPSVKVTIKTISALLCCRLIVKPQFFSELSRALQQKSAPPKAESFLPGIDEPSLDKEHINFGAIPARKQLFTGKTFIFLSAKQVTAYPKRCTWGNEAMLNRLSAAVGFGGGRCQQLEEGHLPRSLLESPQSCVVDLTTASSQTLLSTSAIEWANSVKSIVQRKGLRVITESEIGLAAIHASCENNCNPSSLRGGTVPEVNSQIPSASLSQNMAVDETALPAASQNITAYAVNTEPSQGCPDQRMDRVTSVGETQENKLNQTRNQLSGSQFTAQRNNTQCMVSETITSSIDIVQSAGARKKPDARLTDGGSSNLGPQPSSNKTNGGPKPSFFKPSPLKMKSSSQASPQKQLTLTNFYTSASKKRLLDDEFSEVTSEPKRPTRSSLNTEASKTSTTPKLESAFNLIKQQKETPSVAEMSRKRKVMEEEIQIEELESIMSEDMDGFDEHLSGEQSQEEQPTMPCLFKQKQVVNTEEASNKKPRVNEEESRCTKKQPQADLKTGLQKRPRKQSEPNSVPVRKSPTHSTDHMTSALNNDTDLELLQAGKKQPKEEKETPPKPVQIKQEVHESKIDDNLPQKLVLVEFRSLTVTTPLENKPKQNSSHANNFKCFRKNNGLQRVAHIIGGPDLLVHSRGQNSDLDEWLKDAAEEESQKRREETVGDDLFRYNPAKKQSKRR